MGKSNNIVLFLMSNIILFKKLTLRRLQGTGLPEKDAKDEELLKAIINTIDNYEQMLNIIAI